MGTERKEDEHRSRTQTEEMAEWVRAHTIKSEPPGPTCWKESLAVHVANCPPPARTVPGQGVGRAPKEKTPGPWEDFSQFYSNSQLWGM